MNNKNGLTQKASEEYLASIKKVIELKQRYEQRAAEARGQIRKLEQQLSQVSNQLLEELDREKADKISSESRNLRYQIDDLKLIVDADINKIIREKIDKGIDGSTQAEGELQEYIKWNKSEIERIKKEADDKVKELEAQSRSHPCFTARQMYTTLVQSIKA